MGGLEAGARRRRRSETSRGGALGLGLVAMLATGTAVLAPAPARAAELAVRARTEAQFYSLRAWRRRWDDSETLARQRLYQRLSLYGNDLVRDEDLDVQLALRLGTDLGWRPGEPEALDGVGRHVAEVLGAQLRWRSREPGWELALGRMLRMDARRFRYLDGLEVGHRFGLLQARAWGGQLVKDGSLLGSPTFEPDGVRSSDEALAARVDPEAFVWLSDFHDLPSWVVGAEVGTTPAAGVVATLGWERTFSGGEVDRENVVALVDWRHRALEVAVHFDYDLVLGTVREVETQVGLHARAEPLVVRLEARSVLATFDADSIWTVFSRGPHDTVALHARWQPRGELTLFGRVDATQYHPDLHATWGRAGEPVPLGADGDTTFAGGAEAGAGWRASIGRFARARLFYRWGYGGRAGWAQLDGRQPVTEQLAVSLQAAVGYFDDAVSGGVDGPTVGGRLGFHYRFDEGAEASLFLEEDHSRLARSDFRVYLQVDLGVDL